MEYEPNADELALSGDADVNMLSVPHASGPGSVSSSSVSVSAVSAPAQLNVSAEPPAPASASASSSSSSVSATSSSGTVSQHASELRAAFSQPTVVRPSTTLMKESDPRWPELLFPNLFPFSRGGFGEQRVHKMSREELVRHWMRLSTGAFRGYEFLLFAYDILARQRMMRSACVQAKISVEGLHARIRVCGCACDACGEFLCL